MTYIYVPCCIEYDTGEFLSITYCSLFQNELKENAYFPRPYYFKFLILLNSSHMCINVVMLMLCATFLQFITHCAAMCLNAMIFTNLLARIAFLSINNFGPAWKCQDPPMFHQMQDAHDGNLLIYSCFHCHWFFTP